jgi:ADP-heptose:LPS heptosyltransferase
MYIFISCRNLGDAVIHARLIKSLGLDKDKYKIITTGINDKVYDEFGLKSINLKIEYNGKFNIIKKILLLNKIKKIILQLYQNNDEIVLLYGDMFDWFIKIMLSKRYNIKIPKKNISSINVNQKSRYKWVKNIYNPKINLSNYYENLYEYMGLNNKKINSLLMNTKISINKNILIAPYGSIEVKNIDINILKNIITNLEDSELNYNLLVEKNKLDETKLWHKNKNSEVIVGEINELKAIISNYTHVICTDSFIMHLAGALGKKTLVLTGANKPYYWLHEYAIPLYSSGGCTVFPCSNFPITNCGYSCKKIGDYKLRDKINEFIKN